jgi:hypothetical protein
MGFFSRMFGDDSDGASDTSAAPASPTDGLPDAYVKAFNKAMASTHPAEIQSVADAFGIRGYAPQQALLSAYAQSLPVPPWPPKNGPPPPGTKIYLGVAPAELQDFAKSCVYDPTMTYGMTKEIQIGDKIIIGRIEHHSWSTAGQHGGTGDPNQTVYGSFKGCTLYEFLS